MIIVITTKEQNKKTGRTEIICSHGIDSATNKPVVLPYDSPEVLGAFFDHEIGEYVLPSE